MDIYHYGKSFSLFRAAMAYAIGLVEFRQAYTEFRNLRLQHAYNRGRATINSITFNRFKETFNERRT